MTVLERLKAAGYDPAKAITHYLTAGTGEMECARIAINTFRGLPLERNILVVTATAFTVLPDGSYGLYPEYWPHYLEASARLYFPLDAEFGSCEIDPQNRSEHDRYAQRKHGLVADGICGPKSWTALSGADKYL